MEGQMNNPALFRTVKEGVWLNYKYKLGHPILKPVIREKPRSISKDLPWDRKRFEK